MSPETGERKQRPIECAGAVVRDALGRLLLVQRAQEPSQGHWSLPGGRVEPGETPAEAASREVAEETGLSVRIGELLATVTIGPYLVHDFAAQVTGGQLVAGDDAADVRWCTLDEAAQLPLTEGLLAELSRMGVS
jgi:mutator protein MutT